MSTTRTPVQVASVTPPPPTFQRVPQNDDNDEPINVQMPPQMVNPAAGQFPGMPPQGFPVQQQQPQLPMTSPTPGALTAPRPGALPQPTGPAMAPNPYQPVPLRPGGPGGPGGGPGGGD
jgi:hypothetical protein